MSATDSIKPVSMSRLPTMADMNARPRACPKGATRLDTKKATDKAETKAAEEFRAKVWKRDKSHCRACQRAVIKSLELLPEQGHVHHVAKRSKEPALLVEPRNGVLVCAECHQALEHHELQIVGTAKQVFTHNGQTFLDATKPLRFLKKAPK